jgi:hypothetical protein
MLLLLADRIAPVKDQSRISGALGGNGCGLRPPTTCVSAGPVSSITLLVSGLGFDVA